MKRAIESFRGEAPRVSPRLLPEGAAQQALNARLLTGDLTAWRHFATEKSLANTGPVGTIAKIGPSHWMSWDEEVDVARGITPGDTTYRTYLTAPGLYDQPRFTNLALATTGAEPYPVATRPLGVPGPESAPTTAIGVDPNATTFSVNVLDEGDSLATNWTISPQAVGTSEVYQDATDGRPAPSYLLKCDNNPGLPAYAYRNFGIASATVARGSFDVQTNSINNQWQWRFMAPASDSGLYVAYSSLTQQMQLGTCSGWSSLGASALATAGIGYLAADTWYTVEWQVVVNADNTQTVTATLLQDSAQIQALTVTGNFTLGDYCGPILESTASVPNMRYDNILVQASGSTGYTPTNLATSYVYTFVNDLGQESAPSLPSATILRPDGITVTVTTPTAVPSGVSAEYGITKKRIYRAVTGSTGTAYQFDVEIPLAQADYVDTLTDAELGETLASTDWDLPPDDLEGILALPNGVMAGFRKNQLCLSAQNQPHAWPVAYRLNTDTDIVGIANVDTTVVIGTKSFVYVALGNDPANYSMAKSEVPYAAVSKRSFTYLTGLGVVFAGTDGLMAVAGVGQIRNITDPAFTLRQWQALNPSTVRAVAHNDIYWMFYETLGGEKGCYAIDMKATGFGVVPMSFHATAAWVDPTVDKLYLVLDSLNEPDDGDLPIPPAGVPYTTATIIYEFEGDETRHLTYRYRTKLWLLERPAVMAAAQVRAEDFDNLVVRFSGDGAEAPGSGVVGSAKEFVIGPPSDEAYTEFDVTFIGTSTVRSMQAAEDMNELS